MDGFDAPCSLTAVASTQHGDSWIGLACMLGQTEQILAKAPAAPIPPPAAAGFAAAAVAAAAHAAVAAPGVAPMPLGFMRAGEPWAVNTPVWLVRGILCIYAEGAAAAPNWLTYLSINMHLWN